MTADIQAGESSCLKDLLQEVIEEDAEPEDAEKAKELLQRLEEYKPLAKVEELKKANYNMINNVLNNGFRLCNRRMFQYPSVSNLILD